MIPKRLSLYPNQSHRKSTFLFGAGEQILDPIETICSKQDKFGNNTKTFLFRFQNDIGTFVLSFLTILVLIYQTLAPCIIPFPSTATFRDRVLQCLTPAELDLNTQPSHWPPYLTFSMKMTRKNGL
jgi:hypothetical protein